MRAFFIETLNTWEVFWYSKGMLKYIRHIHMIVWEKKGEYYLGSYKMPQVNLLQFHKNWKIIKEILNVNKSIKQNKKDIERDI